MSKDERHITPCAEKWLGLMTTETRLKYMSSHQYLTAAGLFTTGKVYTDVYTPAALK